MARESTVVDKAIGMALRIERQRVGLSQQALADSCGISFQQIQKYESGKNRVSVSALAAMEVHAKIDAHFILSSAIVNVEGA